MDPESFGVPVEFTVRLPIKVARRLKELGAPDGRSVRDMLERIAEDYVKILDPDFTP